MSPVLQSLGKLRVLLIESGGQEHQVFWLFLVASFPGQNDNGLVTPGTDSFLYWHRGCDPAIHIWLTVDLDDRKQERQGTAGHQDQILTSLFGHWQILGQAGIQIGNGSHNLALELGEGSKIKGDAGLGNCLKDKFQIVDAPVFRIEKMADPHVAVIAHVVFGNLDVAADLAGGVGQGIGDAGRGANDHVGNDLLFQ